MTPAAKRRASVAKKAGLAAKAKAKAGAVPQANAVGNEPWQLVEPDTTTTGSASSSEPREPARAPPPNPAAGSGNPASSVSSGGVEAELKVVIPTGKGAAKGKSYRKEYDYDEGKDGRYTCAQCGMKPLRSWFMIEATDGDGNLRCEYDKEGRLEGRCYECCRGRGKYAGPADIYEDLVASGTHSEEVLQGCFRRECNKRHDKRSDVKKNEHAQLKIKEWKELLAKIIEKSRRTRPCINVNAYALTGARRRPRMRTQP